MNDNLISVDQARYATFIVVKYLDTATVKTSTKSYNTTLSSDMIFTKSNASSSNEEVKKLTRDFDIHHRACIESLIYLLSTIVDLSFAAHKLTKISENLVKYSLKY